MALSDEEIRRLQTEADQRRSQAVHEMTPGERMERAFELYRLTREDR